MEGDSTASERDDRSVIEEVVVEDNWGFDNDVLEDLAIGSRAASAQRGGGASHASHGRCSAACILSVVRTGGAGSISSCSVIATGSV